MPRFKRYKHNGQYMQNTLTFTTLDYVGAYHAYPEVDEAEITRAFGVMCEQEPDTFQTTVMDYAEQRRLLCEHEERANAEANKQDYAVAFGIPADEIEVEFTTWDGRDETIPYASDNSAPVQRIPEEQRKGYVKPVPQPPTLEEKVAALLAASPQATAALGIMDLVTLDGLPMPVTKE